MRFEWDPAKHTTNLRKHGVPFEEAATVFDDPWALVAPDEAHSTPIEAREWLIGEGDGGRTLVVVFTRRDGGAVVRLVSARPADRKERGIYGKSKGISIP